MPSMPPWCGPAPITTSELFGPLQASSVRGGGDAAGWVRGRLAADLAELHAGAVVPGRGGPVDP